jgi:two-component system, OmpR family, response regulator
LARARFHTAWTQTTEKQTSSGSKARFARWELNFSIRELFSPSGDVVPLTTGDFELLAAFVNNPNQVLARDHLFDLARNREAEQFGRTIDVQVSRLRRKIEDDPEKPEMIKTVRGRGYMFTPTVKWI